MSEEYKIVNLPTIRTPSFPYQRVQIEPSDVLEEDSTDIFSIWSQKKSSPFAEGIYNFIRKFNPIYSTTYANMEAYMLPKPNTGISFWLDNTRGPRTGLVLSCKPGNLPIIFHLELSDALLKLLYNEDLKKQEVNKENQKDYQITFSAEEFTYSFLNNLYLSGSKAGESVIEIAVNPGEHFIVVQSKVDNTANRILSHTVCKTTTEITSRFHSLTLATDTKPRNGDPSPATNTSPVQRIK